jgi:hypothetical protein
MPKTKTELPVLPAVELSRILFAIDPSLTGCVAVDDKGYGRISLGAYRTKLTSQGISGKTKQEMVDVLHGKLMQVPALIASRRATHRDNSKKKKAKKRSKKTSSIWTVEGGRCSPR